MGLFDSIADVFDNVKDAVVDVAPVVLPFALNAFAPGLGPIASGALGAGIGSLLQGKDAEDALKAAAIGGGTGALFSGFRGMGQGQGFMEGVKGGLPTSMQASFSAPTSPTAQAYATEGTPADVMQGIDTGSAEVVEAAGTLGKPPGMITSPFAQAPTDMQILASPEYAVLKAEVGGDAALKRLTEQYTPSFMAKYGLPIAGGLAALSLSGQPEEEEIYGDYITGADLIYDEEGNVIPEYQIDVARRRLPTMEDVRVPYRPIFTAEEGGLATIPNKYKGFSKLPENVQQKISPELAKKYEDGGPAFYPRRTGGIGPGEGSGTKDDVPALLMDGEFVMTQNAVKGAGGGSVQKGINNMYSLMRNLENRAMA